MQSCPGEIELNESKNNLRMSVKTIKFSNRPWRYERCVVMEEDLDVERADLKGFKTPPRIPHRIVMNNQTFTVFENFDYQTV